MDIFKAVARNSRNYRKMRHLSQEQLAQRCGLSRGQVYKAENGMNITLDTLNKLAYGLDVAPSRLLVCFDRTGRPLFEHQDSSKVTNNTADTLQNCALVFWGNGSLEFQELCEDSADPSIHILSILAQTTSSNNELLERYKAVWPQVMELLGIERSSQWK